MSRTSVVEFRGRLLLVHTEGLQVWLALLVEAGSEVEARNEQWFRDLLDEWRVQATVADLGCTLDDDWTVERQGVIVALARCVRERLQPGIEPELLRTGWSVLDEKPVADGVGSHNLLRRMSEVADGFIRLLDGTLPPDPPGGWWGVGWARGDWVTILRRSGP